MPYRKDWERLIRALAPKYGVDPQAALAVASAEGLSGGVGDGGHAFGPFQLNDAGGVITGRPGNHRAFAESPEGIEWALGQIGRVAKGLKGRAAVEAIVRRFERPAAPDAEITRARGAMGGFGGSGAPGGVSSPPLAATPTPDQGGDFRSQLAMSLLQKGGPDWLALAAVKKAGEFDRFRGSPASDLAQTAAGFSGNVIGTPGSGTHTLGNWESDRAVDEAMPEGTPIRAPFDGTIGQQFGSLGKGGRFAGLRLHVVGQNDEFYGAHLSRFAKGIAPGVHVRKGQIIGYSGSANGVPHLHEALRRGNPRSLVPLT